MKREYYMAGGYIPAHPSGNKSEVWDTDAGTYTRWDEAGNVVESRPLTDAEIASLTPSPDPRAAKLAEIEATLADTPLLADETAQVLADLLALAKGEV